MTDNSSIDVSVANVWRSYLEFRKGKKPSRLIVEFEYNLLNNILELAQSMQNGTYVHGSYVHMIVNDNKRRDIAVATVRDRVVHRLLYDYLVPIWDKTFIFDVWSCRQNKGLHSGINRAQTFMANYSDTWLWRADITKMFDSIDKGIMKSLLTKRIVDPLALRLLYGVIDSYSSFDEVSGIPIGNLTSQIFANIYLNEFDRFMKHEMKPLAYLRYGDDWLCFAENENRLKVIREQSEVFLREELCLTIQPRLNFIKPVDSGVSFLGVDLWSAGHRLTKGMQHKITKNLNFNNVASYKSLISQHQSQKYLDQFEWTLIQHIIDAPST